MNEGAKNLSSYAANLSKEAKDRYVSKISIINGADPFLGVIVEAEATSELPPVEAASDLVSYLVLQTTSFITSSQFKARKSLEAYNKFLCGWVKDVTTAGKFLTSGCVSI